MRRKTQQIFFLVIGFTILIILGVMIFGVSKSESRGHDIGMPVGSTFSNAFDGSKLLFEYLKELGFEVEQSKRPLTADFYENDDFDVLWHVSGKVAVDMEELEWIQNWVLSGGTLILSSIPSNSYKTALDLAEPEFADNLIKYWMEILDTRTRQAPIEPDADRIQVVASRSEMWPLEGIDEVSTHIMNDGVDNRVYRLTRSKEMTQVLGDGYGAVIGNKKIGQGNVWIIADPYLFSNLLIQESDNAAVIASILLGSRNAEKAKVVFDEYHLGFVQTRDISDAARTPFGRALLYLGAVAVLGIASGGARFGRIRKADSSIGVSQKALVVSLAELWSNSNSVNAAIEILHRKYRNRASVKQRGLDKELERMKTNKGQVSDELLKISAELDK